MFANLKGIKFNTSYGIFNKDDILDLFPKRFNVLYGKNGSGKSTIAKAINNLKTPIDVNSAPISFLNKETTPNNRIISLSEEDKKNIFVFNEDFIERNVKIAGNGLNTIVMLGAQVELDNQIQEQEVKRTNLNSELVNLVTALENCETAQVNTKNQIKNTLTTNWSEREMQIKGTRQKGSVTETLIAELLTMSKIPANISDISAQIEKSIKNLQKTKGQEIISWNLKNIELSADIDVINTKLKTIISSPKLEDRDKKIIEIVSGSYGHYINNVKSIFQSPSVTTCPLCLRSIDDSEKQELFRIVECILNKDADDFKNELESFKKKFSEITINPPQFDFENSNELIAILSKNIHEYNSEQIKAKAIIDKKMENILSPFHNEIDKQILQEKIDCVNNVIQNINSLISKYNETITAQNEIKKDALALNKTLARLELDANITLYNSQEQSLQSIKNSKNAKELEITQCDLQITNLKAQKQNVTIAFDFIQQAMAYVFFDRNRMSLKKDDGCYKLTSRNKDVEPKDVSVGERNIIALCYFFANIFAGRTEATKYSIPSLIIIDDPVSSFDFENRVGVISFLKWMIDSFYKGNEYTTILLMTHDISTIFDLEKVESEIFENGNKNYIELKNKSLAYEVDSWNEYKKMFATIFSFAKGSCDQNAQFIGNQMRKVMEAYSSFIYSIGFEDLLHNDEILKQIPKDRQLYYKNLMSRLVLNGDSHKQEGAYSMDISKFKYTFDEKKNIAKSIIMFLYYINSLHVKAMLPSNTKEQALAQIKTWENDGFDKLQ